MKLNTELNIADPDAFYERLIETHAGLTDAQSLALNAKAVALLSDLIGDEKVLQEAAGIAAEGLAADNRPEYDAKLLLLLANHAGDIAQLARMLDQARATVI
ncbi:MAG TPA: DUF2783 domain-containing protein [Bordetella sp.]|uniref:DUF2783 domain-containing protein n=1 Tax=Bordetella sp. TaxID=28081 RepID=UPI002ED0FEBF